MRTLIRDVRVFDGEQTAARTDVLIDGNRIAEPDSRRVDVEVDGTGKTLLPGLIDAHTHTSDGSLAQALAHGVTTELDMFCLPANLDKQRRLAAESDNVADLRSAGLLATAPGGHPSQLLAGMDQAMLDGLGATAGTSDGVADASQAKTFVDARVAQGIDYLKVVIDGGSTYGTVLPALAPGIVAALVEAGQAAGLLTIAHATTAREVEIALDAGIDGLAHVYADAGPEDSTARDLATRIASVTSAPARYFGLTDRGRIAPGSAPTCYWSTATPPTTSPQPARSPKSGAAAPPNPVIARTPAVRS
ncbi:hypothetical protein [Kribbella sp. DT2]|uniref:hypothetical protein n=1 Tax=Kribbella sp. DT2 TaxID=3393427 RepID=UPI003CEDE23D